MNANKLKVNETVILVTADASASFTVKDDDKVLIRRRSNVGPWNFKAVELVSTSKARCVYRAMKREGYEVF